MADPSPHARLPVVLLASLGRGARDFDLLVDALHAAGFDARALEPVGADPFVDAAADQPTLHDLAAAVVARLDDADLEQVHLVGHAFGQRLARCIVADHPERVATLTMLAAGGLVAMPDDIARSLMACFDLDLPPDEHLDHVRRMFFASGNDPTAWEHGWHPRIAALQSAAVRRTDPSTWTDAVAERVLVVQGLQDACAVPENGRRFAAAHPDVVTLVEIDGAGHALLPEQPDAVAAALIDFLHSSDPPREPV